VERDDCDAADTTAQGGWGMKIIEKPWGREVWWGENEHYLAKILEVNAGAKLSRQYHRVKVETMYCTEGHGTLEFAERMIDMAPGVAVDIPAGTVHRLMAAADSRLIVFEVSTPQPDDIVRLEDSYGRR
jgi:mannose-6-phosphate isomerase-like protein (cupin superfamily)